MRNTLIAIALVMTFGEAGVAESDSIKQATPTKTSSEPDTASAKNSTDLQNQLVELQNQEVNLQGQLVDLDRTYLETQRKVNTLSRLKISGYAQIQWQYAGSDGAPSADGGNFPFDVSDFADPSSNVLTDLQNDSVLDTLAARQRFQIPRARLRFAYDAGTSKLLLVFNLAPAGVSIKDANISVWDPWLKIFQATFGITEEPFGFEVPYSPASLETPEASRFAQTVFPGFLDLGAMLEARPTQDMGLLQYLDVKGGLFTGMGGLTPDYTDIDNHMAFIGRAGFKAPIGFTGLELDGGFSAYLGEVTDRNDSAFSMHDTTLVLTEGNKGKAFDRKVYGTDAELYYTFPVIGTSTLRGEYYWAKMPGTLESNGPYDAPSWPTTALFERNMMGWYVMWVQNLGELLQAVMRYDVFDPNTDITGADVIQTYSTSIAHPNSPADLEFKTFGFGLNYNWDKNLRLTAYYEIVANEKASASNKSLIGDNPYEQASEYHPNPLEEYTNALQENVFTFRAQFQF